MTEHNHKQGECRELLKDLSDYVDGDLDETLCLEIEHHMAECDNCRVVVDTLRRTVLLYHALPSEPMPGEVEARLLKRLELSEYLDVQ